MSAVDRKPGEAVINTLGMKFAWIPPGTFMMGSPNEEEYRQVNEPQHKVTMTKGFYLGVHLVTQAQWQAVMGQHPKQLQGREEPAGRTGIVG